MSKKFTVLRWQGEPIKFRKTERDGHITIWLNDSILFTAYNVRFPSPTPSDTKRARLINHIFDILKANDSNVQEGK